MFSRADESTKYQVITNIYKKGCDPGTLQGNGFRLLLTAMVWMMVSAKRLETVTNMVEHCLPVMIETRSIMLA